MNWWLLAAGWSAEVGAFVALVQWETWRLNRWLQEQEEARRE